MSAKLGGDDTTLVASPPGIDISATTLLGGPPIAPASPDTIDASSRQGEPLVELLAGTILGRFVTLGKLGAGGMGIVYAAYDPELDRKVAIKLLRPEPTGPGPEAKARLLREAQALARLSHPNVVAIYDVGAVGQHVWLAMEFVQGQTFGAWCRQKPRTWQQTIEVMERAGRGLEAAHAAGLIHRDFKPDNIMVDADGRVRVMDLGLARRDAAASLQEYLPLVGSRPDVPTLDTPLTRVGAIIGTPAYMAPEQFSGEHADVRTDVFSFSLTLWEALFGERPFSGNTFPELAISVTTGKLRTPKNHKSVPGWLSRIVARGLAPERTKRWQSITAMLHEVERRRRRTKWRIAGGGLAILAVAVGGLQATSLAAAARRRSNCELKARATETRWNDEARSNVRRAMLDTRMGYAEAVSDYVIPWLDGYADTWRLTSEKVCLEDQPLSDHRGSTAGRTHWCLATRRTAFESLITDFSRADAGVVRNAVMRAVELRPVESCIDPAHLSGSPSPRIDQWREFERLDLALASAKELARTSGYLESLSAIEMVRARAAALGWLPLVASADYAAGMTYENLGEYRRAADSMANAFHEAAIGGAPEIMAESAMRLTSISSNKLAHYQEALQWARHAEIPLSTLEPSVGLWSAYRLAYLAGTYEDMGELRKSIAAYRQAVDLEEKILGEDNPRVATLLSNLGSVLHDVGSLDDARNTLERSLTIKEAAFGGRHPDLVSSLNNLGNVYMALGNRDKARSTLSRALSIGDESIGPNSSEVAECLNSLAAAQDDLGETRRLLERALAIRERLYAPNHPDIAKTLNNLAVVHFLSGSHSSALIGWQRVATIQATTLGTNHPDLATTLLNLGAVQLMIGALSEARASNLRAIEILRRSADPKTPMIGLVLVNLAEISVAEHKPSEGRRYATDALEHLRRALGSKHVDVAYAHLAMGEIELASGNAAEAATHASRALELREQGKARPDLIAQAKFCLARTLWHVPSERGDQHERAHELATGARSTYREIQGTDKELSEIDHWLAQRPVKATPLATSAAPPR